MSVWGEPDGPIQYNYAAADAAASWVNAGVKQAHKLMLSHLDELESEWCSCRECDQCMSAPFARNQFDKIRARINGDTE